jgi:hypothetical protein
MRDEAPPDDVAGHPYVKARRFFADQIRTAKDGIDDDSKLADITDALLDLFKIVVIDLEENDDAQIIFEVLNGRQTPLSASDLVKNLLFCGPSVPPRTSMTCTTTTGENSTTHGGKPRSGLATQLGSVETSCSVCAHRRVAVRATPHRWRICMGKSVGTSTLRTGRPRTFYARYMNTGSYIAPSTRRELPYPSASKMPISESFG